MAPDNQTTRIANLLQRLQAGEETARDDLIEHMYERLRRLTAKMLRDYPNVKRWDQTDDVWQQAVLRLSKALGEVQPDSVESLLGLAAQHIRWTLLDLARRHQGPHGLGKQLQTGHDSTNRQFDAKAETSGPQTLAEYTELHRLAEELPEEEREVFELCYYNELPNNEVAELIGASERTVQRRLRSAKGWLHRRLHGTKPAED